MADSYRFLNETLEDFRAILKRVYIKSGTLTDFGEKVKRATEAEINTAKTPEARLARKHSTDVLAEADRNDSLILGAVARVFMSMPQDLSLSLRKKFITPHTPFGRALVADLAVTPISNSYEIKGLEFSSDPDGPWNNLAMQIADQGTTFREQFFTAHPGLDGFEL